MGKKLRCKTKTKKVIKTSTMESVILKNENPPAAAESEPKLFLITDRLTLPPYCNEGAELESSELQLDIRPRGYFVTGLCYSCSKPCVGTELLCEGCHMVGYCSTKHRHQEAESHSALCAVLKNLDLLRSTSGLDAENYRRFRVDLVLAAQMALSRSLEPREREILLYPKLCSKCHSADGVERCSKCLIVFHCPGNHALEHKQYCSQFSVFRRILELERTSGFRAPEFPAFFTDEMPENFDQLVKWIFQRHYEKIDSASYAALSQTSSCPLTVLYVIRNLPQCASYTKRTFLKIHVIGAELQFECTNLTLWEKLFLHLLPDVRGLRLEFYGPELWMPADLVAVLQKPLLCPECRSTGKILDIVFHCGKLYHQVISEEPDLVCLFNPGLYRTTGYANKDTWPPTIEKLCRYGVPIIVTSYTEVELPLDLKRLRELQNVEIVMGPLRNPFASLRPERNFVSDDLVPLIYKNYYIGAAMGIP